MPHYLFLLPLLYYSTTYAGIIRGGESIEKSIETRI